MACCAAVPVSAGVRSNTGTLLVRRCRRRRRKKATPAARAMTAATETPTPMPILAGVERPDGPLSGSADALLVTAPVPLVVGVVVADALPGLLLRVVEPGGTGVGRVVAMDGVPLKVASVTPTM